MSDSVPSLPSEYEPFLEELKARIRSAQVKAAVSVNRELVLLYWTIGRQILSAQETQGWGAKVIERLADDLRSAFPDMKGFSPRNLKYMRSFAEAWPEPEFVQQLVAQIPWGHNVRLLDRLSDPVLRTWYAQQTIQNGWSRNVLELQIDTKLHERLGAAITNFDRTLPLPQSDLARQITKDPYNFEFLTLQADAEERAIEKGLVAHIQKFLLELGVGFAYVGNQYPLEVDGEDYFIDLLFYHLKLRCYVVIELKAGKFKPEYAGKMNFYLSAVDDLLRHPDDAPSIGLILCKEKKQVAVEYSLRNTSTPIGVSGYQITETLPDEFKASLPTVEEIEQELRNSPE